MKQDLLTKGFLLSTLSLLTCVADYDSRCFQCLNIENEGGFFNCTNNLSG